MLVALSLATCMTVGAAVAAPLPADDDARAKAETALVLEQARRDFEARHAELGLLGAAPLPGTEASQDATLDSAGATLNADVSHATRRHSQAEGRKHLK